MGKDWCSRLILTKDKTIVAGDLLFDDKPKITGKILDYRTIQNKCFLQGYHGTRRIWNFELLFLQTGKTRRFFQSN